jgi:hypothetical protein
VTVIAKDLPALVVEVNRLEARVKVLELENVDLRGQRRVVNSPRSQKHNDLITRGEVEELLKNLNDTINRLNNVT